MSTIDDELVVAHFIVSNDVERSRRFYTEVLGGRTVISGEASLLIFPGRCCAGTELAPGRPASP